MPGDFHSATLAIKCEGRDDEQAAVISVPPSGFTLTGLVQHLAEVERNWFRRVLAGEQARPIYDPGRTSETPGSAGATGSAGADGSGRRRRCPFRLGGFMIPQRSGSPANHNLAA